ncbi:MAG: ABC transporter ATP-binding protein [Deltaproteobacteria bacterium]|nr:ABC transporter ATP-binding protein [Deltaproteobacteria bacterium]
MKNGSPAPGDSEHAVFASSLVKRYKKTARPALHGFNLHVQRGEFFGLLGANGAGKTTAISIFSTLFPPDSGSVLIMGVDPVQQPNKVRLLSGLVPQDIALYENLTVVENLQFFGRLSGLHGKQLESRVEWCLDFAGLSGRAVQLVSTCSGGMKRRLNLAAGLLHAPQILFLDEPTVGIDAQSRALIHDQLIQLNKKGTTIIYTTHYMEEAQELCSRIGIIDEGRIVIQGNPAELLRQSGKGTLEEFFLQLTGRELRDV